MATLSTREKVLVGLCVVVVATVGLLQWLGRPPAVSGDPRALAARQAALTKAVAAERKRVEQLSTPRLAALPRALAAVSAAAQATGVQVDSARPLRDAVSGRLIRHGVQFNARGTFPQVVSLLERLSTAERTIAVEAVDITAAGDESDEVQVQIRLAGYEPAPQNAKSRRVRS